MSKGISEERRDSFKALRRNFEESFVRDCIPGMLHNFANHLNGILGRSELLQRRMMELYDSIQSKQLFPDKTRGDCRKALQDISLINNEADKIFNLFNCLAGKFSCIQETNLQKINLSHLMEGEVAFLDFYLDFKHYVTKELNLEHNIPEVIGIPADYSVSFSAILRAMIRSTQDEDSREIKIATAYDESHVFVTMKQTKLYRHLPPDTECPGRFLESDREFTAAQALLWKYHADITQNLQDGQHVVTIKIPY